MTMKQEAKPVVVARPDPNPLPSPLRLMSGSDYDKFANILTNQVASALWKANSTAEEAKLQIEASFEAMAGIRPQDETEGMLAAQMVALHSAAMECYRRAMIKEQSIEGRQQNLNFAVKLSRTYALHMEALDKHRGKGQQKVTVEHVHVHQGGQAIVGSVQAGVGGATKVEGQVHAKNIAHSPEPEMRRPFATDREAVPQRRDEEREV